mgnify:CR=1 FL=1|tara:strand:+ start:15089 stop:15457 length:369 start_codon:yes stop_codon:yes gene_type:complete
MQLDHINIVTPDVPGTTDFLVDVLGLQVGFRPGFPFPGAWLYGSGDQPAIVHLVEGDIGGGPTGALDHVAFRGEDMTSLIDKLAARSIEHNSRQIPGTGDHQVFFVAPFGLKIEVNFTQTKV